MIPLRWGDSPCVQAGGSMSEVEARAMLDAADKVGWDSGGKVMFVIFVMFLVFCDEGRDSLDMVDGTNGILIWG